MDISYLWLKELLPNNLSPEELASVLTSIGLETGSIEERESIKGGLKGLVIGHVLEVAEHENSDHLHVCKVDIGDGNEPYQIVCGASNVEAGKAAIVATIGTVLYDGDKEFTIKKSKIRGVESFGMLCGETEIGVGNDDSGIIKLELSDVQIGMPASEYYNVKSDYILEVDITPNRNDATSHYGVARDLAAALSASQNKDYKAILPKVNEYKIGSSPVSVEVESSADCPRFMSAVIRGVEVKDSPEWLRNRIESIGLNSINNIVDISNYVLHEFGQPMHIYDLSTIGSKAIVKRASEGAKITTLDNVDRILSNSDLAIHSEKSEPLCLAGVMGGVYGSVTNDTKDIFIEVANFNPTLVRKTARRLAISSDSSFRFERGLDANNCKYAMFRALDLLLAEAGGTLDGDVADYYPEVQKAFDIEFSIQKMNNLIGENISLDIVERILNSLEIKILSKDADIWHLEVPRYRIDVERDVDVIEDILRIYGYNNIPLDGYIKANLGSETYSDRSYRRTVVISEQLLGEGYNEILNNSLSSESYYEGLESFKTSELVFLKNPLSNELNVMRQTLLFGALQSLERNIKRQQKSFYYFEWGNVSKFKATNDTELSLKNYKEQARLSLLVAGMRNVSSWIEPNKEVSPFELKASALNILDRLGIDATMRVEKLVDFDIFSGKSLEILNQKGVSLLRMGKVKGSILKMMDIDLKDVFYAELDWDAINKIADQKKIEAQDLSKYPSVKRDLSLLIDKSISFDDIRSIVMKVDRKIIREVILFDVYEGKNLPEGKKSYAISITLQDDTKTMSDKQIDAIMQKVQGNLKKELSAELR